MLAIIYNKYSKGEDTCFQYNFFNLNIFFLIFSYLPYNISELKDRKLVRDSQNISNVVQVFWFLFNLFCFFFEPLFCTY